MTTRKYSNTRDSIMLFLFAMLFLIGIMAFGSCSSERKGCQMRRGFIGYENR